MRMRRFALVAVTSCFLSLVAHAQSAGGFVKDERWGFKVRTPKRFSETALGADEETIALKSIGKRVLRPKKSPIGGAAPEMSVLGFPRSKRVAGTDVRKAYLDSLAGRGGFSTGKHRVLKERAVKGVDAQDLELRFDSAMMPSVRVLARLYRFDDIDFAVECRVIDDHFKSHEKAFLACLKSFARIPRTRALPGAAASGSGARDGSDSTLEDSEDDGDKTEDLSPEERAERLRASTEEDFQRQIDALPKSWRHHRTANYLLLGNAPMKFIKKSGNHAEAVRSYCEKHLGGVGDGYVPAAIIRVFANGADELAYRSRNNDWLAASNEVLVSEDRGYFKNAQYGQLNERLFRQWISFKSPHLNDNMPDWIRKGLGQHMRFLKSSGKRASHKTDPWNRDQLREMVKGKRQLRLQQLLIEDGGNTPVVGAVASNVMDRAGNTGMTFDPYTLQAGSVVTWLLGKGNKGTTKGILTEYLGYLVTATDEAAGGGKARDKKADMASLQEEVKGAESEADRQEVLKKWQQRRAAVSQKRGEIGEQAFNAVFGGYTAADWKKLDRSWAAFAK